MFSSTRLLVAIVCFLALAGCGSPFRVFLTPPSPVIVPSCSNPAPLNGKFDARATGFIVVLTNNANVASDLGMLASRYQFVPDKVYVSINGFFAELTDSVVAELRCESVVKYIEHNAHWSLGGSLEAL
jgi:hypothetical protein